MKIKFSPWLKEVRGKMGDSVFRLCHTGEWQITSRPNMSKVRWSPAQLQQRERMAEATEYANTVKDHPEARAFYLQMAHEKKDNNRWFDMAVSDYYHNHINRMGPWVFYWDAQSWRERVEKERKRRKRKRWLW